MAGFNPSPIGRKLLTKPPQILQSYTKTTLKYQCYMNVKLMLFIYSQIVSFFV